MEEIKISENQRKVLENLVEIYGNDSDCRFFRGIARDTGLEERLVRLACRALARKGLTEFVRGLFDDDGMVAGSGYRATMKGYQFLENYLKQSQPK